MESDPQPLNRSNDRPLKKSPFRKGDLLIIII